MVETEETEEEAAEKLEASLEMEVEEEGKREEGGDGTLRALGTLAFLNHEAEPSETTLIDARNGFNELSRLEMLWTVRHRWPEGSRFAFNCYRHWAKLLLRQTGDPLLTILSREGGTQGDPPLDGIVQDNPHPPGQGAKSRRPRSSIPVIRE